MKTARTINTDMLGWAIRFSLAALVFVYGARSSIVTEHVIPKAVSVMVRWSSLLLSFLGVDHSTHGSTILAASEQFTVSGACTGLSVFALFAAAVLSFPASLRARIEGLAAGLLSLCLLNILRIGMIVIVGSRFPDTFWGLHVIVGQAIIIAGISAVFLVWLSRLSDPGGLSGILLRAGLTRRIIGFVVAYACGFALYLVFLDTWPGRFLSGLVERHTAVGITVIEHLFSGVLTTGPMPVITFVPGCLSSPVFVIILAGVAAWPMDLKKKILVLVLGFIPLFYAYHLIRALMTVASLASGASRETSLIYNCFGQFVLTGVGILAYWSHAWVRRTPGDGRMFLAGLLAGILAGIVGLFAGGALQDLLLPVLAGQLAPGQTRLFDPQLTVTSMLRLQFFCLLTLIWSPGVMALGSSQRLRKSLFGSLLLFLFFILLMAGVLGLGIEPHVGVLKTWVVFLPFAVFYWLMK